MFDALKGMAGMAGLVKDLPKIKARMAQVKEELARTTVHADSGGGAVRITATAQLRIVAVTIDQSMVAAMAEPGRPVDRAMVEELILEATNAALEKARQRAEQALADAAEELNLPIPAGGLGGLLG